MKRSFIICLLSLASYIISTAQTPSECVDDSSSASSDSIISPAAEADSLIAADTMLFSAEATEIGSTNFSIPADIAMPPALPAITELPGKRSHSWVSPYALPYSTHATSKPNWHRMWINTAVLSGAFVGTLLVLECLPEDATSWNRATLQQTPMFERWYKNIFVHNPEIDHDKFIFNYILHPYAGAAYFMSARSCGFSFWGSMLYSFTISTVGWEFGIEAFMERPSYQDIFITPAVGSVLGELMYRGKRAIIERDYDVAGSRFLGHTLCFFLDPVNEVIDLFRGNPCHEIGAEYGRARKATVSSSFAFSPSSVSLKITF